MRRIVGVDEVGRGCLAGPVVAAAVVLPKHPGSWISEIKDSKKLSSKKRQVLAEYITKECVYAIRSCSEREIEDINILQATLRAMKKCVDAINTQVDFPLDLVLVDGNHKIPELDLPQEALIGGDSLHKAIGAASIIAKVYRDNYMAGMGPFYPEYGFAKHKGYGTFEHREAIMVHGPCPMHRKTFKGVYEYVKS